jgi:hypothetical protein
MRALTEAEEEAYNDQFVAVFPEMAEWRVYGCSSWREDDGYSDELLERALAALAASRRDKFRVIEGGRRG